MRARVATTTLGKLLQLDSSKLTSWNEERYAALLLAFDDAEAVERVRQLAPKVASALPHGASFWQDIEAALRLAPLERVLRCLEVTGSDHALEGLQPVPGDVPRIVEGLLGAESAFDREVHAPKRRLSLPVLWALGFADVPTIERFLDELRPTTWIESAQRARLGDERGLQRHEEDCRRDVSEPGWAVGRWKAHPARYRDGLTGAWSRAALLGAAFEPEERLLAERAWDGDLRDQWLIDIDIDGMKERADYFGHLAGDLAIMHVADALHRVCGDRVVRYGGDEFFALVDADGPGVAERMRLAVEQSPIAPRAHIEEHLSCTITLAVTQGGPLREAARRTERGVQRGKEAGRNLIVEA